MELELVVGLFCVLGGAVLGALVAGLVMGCLHARTRRELRAALTLAREERWSAVARAGRRDERNESWEDKLRERETAIRADEARLWIARKHCSALGRWLNQAALQAHSLDDALNGKGESDV